MAKRIVVVGGGAAGATAAAKAKRVNPGAEVVLVEAGPYVTHAPCAVPYAIAQAARLYIYTAEQFAREKGVVVYTNTKAEVGEGGRLRLSGAVSGALEWDAMIIATGASPRVPQVEGVELEGVQVVRHPAEAEAIKKALQPARRVVVVGGGYIGLEMAEVLLAGGKDVVLLESGRWILNKMLDEDMARLVEQYIAARGGQLRLGETLTRIVGRGRVERVETTGGSVETDAVVLATGVRPNVELAKALGARLGETGAVWTDEFLETSVPGVYAAGDVAEVVHKVTGRRTWMPLAPYANKMGYVAGYNAGAGEKRVRFPPVVGAAVTKFFDMYIGKAGLGEAEARQYGIGATSAVVKTSDKAAFMPDAREIYVKAVASRGVLIGVEVVGFSPYVAAVVDFAAQLIGRPVEEVILAEYSYMPHTGPVWHPLVSAARLLD
ncbi:FAD-dependent oxidoreductase [Pyrobaculum calidifontis]|uniref:FAD-dependent pyridine nucleotide-disulfide oxidoreductase n=1 Tax=Pyrobaculum calidifontis (strain DSM 21063 / JCM 11548 / VA1) TaxID=410359 RepID=A3MVZ3_PYRCJ|nr:FAD-dependent oxidoreductase [Pyrobaculum calidifontis]ABO08810.1 FAD-dependent pyridine nucleotide-disulfide oxidoreductase [Pyrobaculum calidifontis JCM 11548]